MVAKKFEGEIKVRAIKETNRMKDKPCVDCRKRDSCLLHPHNEVCRSFEAGIPWSMQYNSMLVDYDITV